MNMTPEQERELDAWIAEKVFGKRVIRYRKSKCIADFYTTEEIPHYTQGERFRELLEKCALKCADMGFPITLSVGIGAPRWNFGAAGKFASSPKSSALAGSVSI